MIYFIAQRNEYVKIGYTGQCVESRLAQLQTGNPHVLSILHTMPGDLDTERYLHTMFYKYRVRAEWFYLTAEITNFINHGALSNKQKDDLEAYEEMIQSNPARTHATIHGLSAVPLDRATST